MYTFSNTKDEILNSDNEHIKKAAENSREIFSEWKDKFSDSTKLVSGWSHNFVCPKCASQFEFSYPMPKEFTCRHCGYTSTDDAVRAAWIAEMRYYTVRKVLYAAALLCKTGERQARDFIIRFFDFYADNYKDFAPHGEWAGVGKIMGQSLCESVWLMHSVMALEASGIDDAEKINSWKEKLFSPMCLFLDEQVKEKNNISLWIKSAIASAALYLDDEELFERACGGENGIDSILAECVTEDGMWNESSVHYHNYAFEGFTYFCMMYEAKKGGEKYKNVLLRAYKVLKNFLVGDDFAASNDGWFPLSPGFIAQQLICAARVLKKSDVYALLTIAKRQNAAEFETPFAAHFLCDFPEETAKKEDFAIMKASNFAFISKPFDVVLKSGVLNSKHMHADYLSLAVSDFSKDLGTPGYGHEMHRKYYKQTICHNTFLLDSASHPASEKWERIKTAKSSVEEVEGGFVMRVWDMTADKDSPYYMCRAERRVISKGEYISDSLTVFCPNAKTVDFVFHSEGECDFSCGENDVLCGSEQYSYLSGVKNTGLEKVALSFKKDGKTLFFTAEGGSVYTAKMPSNPADILLNCIVLRKRGQSAAFNMTYKIEDK